MKNNTNKGLTSMKKQVITEELLEEELLEEELSEEEQNIWFEVRSEKIQEVLESGELLGKIVASQSDWADDDYVFFQIIKAEHDPLYIEMVALASTYDESTKTFHFEKDKFHESKGLYIVITRDRISDEGLYSLFISKEYTPSPGEWDGEVVMIDSYSQYTIPQERIFPRQNG